MSKHSNKKILIVIGISVESSLVFIFSANLLRPFCCYLSFWQRETLATQLCSVATSLLCGKCLMSTWPWWMITHVCCLMCGVICFDCGELCKWDIFVLIAIALPFLRESRLRFWISSSSSVDSRFLMWLNSAFYWNSKFADLDSAFQSLGTCISRVTGLAFKGRDVVELIVTCV